MSRTLNDALSRGFSAGNYANAYVSEDLQKAWHKELEDLKDEDLNRDELAAYHGAFIIGFWGTYEDYEIPARYRREFRSAYDKWSLALRDLGLAVERGHDDDDVGTRAPNRVREHNIRTPLPTNRTVDVHVRKTSTGYDLTASLLIGRARGKDLESHLGGETFRTSTLDEARTRSRFRAQELAEEFGAKNYQITFHPGRGKPPVNWSR